MSPEHGTSLICALGLILKDNPPGLLKKSVNFVVTSSFLVLSTQPVVSTHQHISYKMFKIKQYTLTSVPVIDSLFNSTFLESL